MRAYDTEGMGAIEAMLADSSSGSSGLALVVVVLAGSLIFAWIVGIAEIAGRPENEFATGTRTTWLLLVIFTGIIGLVAYVFVGKKREAPALVAPTRAAKYHTVGWDETRRLWVCSERGCGLTFDKETQANLHRKLTGTGSVPVAPSRSAPPPAPAITSPPEEMTPATPEFKTCPDCAEQVRFAARKCRFCGYMFEDASADA
jgi:hypothetical protein